MKEYEDIFRVHKFHIGQFPHWQAKAKMNNTILCKQKKRSIVFPPSAERDILSYQKARVFEPSVGGTDRFCANLTLTKRPSAHSSRFDTLADKNQAKIDKKLGSNEARQEAREH